MTNDQKNAQHFRYTFFLPAAKKHRSIKDEFRPEKELMEHAVNSRCNWSGV